MTVLGRMVRSANLDSLASVMQWNGIVPRSQQSAIAPVVTPDRAMRVMAVWRCSTMLADIISGLPIAAFRTVAQQRLMMPSQPSLLTTPSHYLRASEWRYELVMSALLRGNGYGAVTSFDSAMWPQTAEILNPDRVKVQCDERTGEITYVVSGSTPIPAEEMIHFRAFLLPGSIVGLAPIEYARNTLGTAIGAQDYGLSWYQSGGHPTSVLQSDQKIDPDTARLMKERFRQATDGDHLAVLGSGLELKTLQVSPADALFLDSIHATDAQIAGFFGVPPEFIGAAVSGSSVTYANREQRWQDFLNTTVLWWIQRLEETMTGHLPRPQTVKIDYSELLRADAQTRATVEQIDIRNGLNSRNEIRARRGEPPIDPALDPEGDAYIWPPVGQGAGMDVRPPTTGGVEP